MPRTTPLYRWALSLTRVLEPVAARWNGKASSAVRGRTGVVARFAAWGATCRDPSRPLLWMHAPSVGEGLQAEAVLLEVRRQHPDWQIAFTHFSPSAVDLAKRIPAHISDFLPWDRQEDVARSLDALRPSAIVFTKADLWPELATQAAARGIKIGIVAATVGPGSSRLGWAARTLLRAGYHTVSRAGAISAADAERLARLGVPAGQIEVTGDPRFDSVLAKVSAVADDDAALSFGRGAETLVAGSTWEEDEEVLFKAFAAVRTARPAIRLIVAPHEPTPAYLDALDRRAAAQGLPTPIRLSAATAPAPFLVVDRMGVLASLYGGATIAYVGGGFGKAGLHSVLEPAAWSVPVLFGPRWQQSREAGELLAARAGAVVSPEFPDWLDLDPMATYAGVSPLASLWLALLRNPGHARAAGRRAREYVEAGAGAAARNAGLVERLVEAGRISAR
ncbi:MAG: hypothetical protein HOP28_04630 [Gemmatimonadales bacterium]|nr:hypothetical protein [Gemmatimonadales bacterium]